MKYYSGCRRHCLIAPYYCWTQTYTFPVIPTMCVWRNMWWIKSVVDIIEKDYPFASCLYIYTGDNKRIGFTGTRWIKISRQNFYNITIRFGHGCKIREGDGAFWGMHCRGTVQMFQIIILPLSCQLQWCCCPIKFGLFQNAWFENLIGSCNENVARFELKVVAEATWMFSWGLVTMQTVKLYLMLLRGSVCFVVLSHKTLLVIYGSRWSSWCSCM